MFLLAIFIGLYAYGIFVLGIFGLLTRLDILSLTIVWLVLLVFFEKSLIVSYYKRIRRIKFTSNLYKNFIFLFVLLFALQAVVNLVGALGPELAFDALWYHLTLPKLYLLNHSIYHIPGSLLYYSDMPKLGEMLYVGALGLGNEISAKVLHYLFGILTCIALYKISRKFFTQYISLLVVVIFYSNLVVATESITAYIDLIRAFFEVMTLWAFLSFYDTAKLKWLLLMGCMTGLAVTTKVLGVGSVIIFSFLLFLISFDQNFSRKIKIQSFHFKNKYAILFIYIIVYLLITLLIPMPWFIFSFVHTGNPVYPFFTQRYEIATTSFGFLSFFVTLWNLFMYSPDPIAPVYLLFLPLLFIFYPKLQKEIKIIVVYSCLNIILWYFTPQTGGGRFILPYLPAFSIICAAIYTEILKIKTIEWKYVSRFTLFTIVFVAFISIGYRSAANSKYIPVLVGKESQGQFLTNHLNFSFGDFYDTDGYFSHHIKQTDTVLLYGFHNLYYVDFPFIDSSWVKKGDKFDYLALQNMKKPSRFHNWQLVYSNDKTMVKLYTSPIQKYTTY